MTAYELITAAEAPARVDVPAGTVRSWAHLELVFSWGLDPHGRPLYRVDHLEQLRDRPRRGPRRRATIPA